MILSEFNRIAEYKIKIGSKKYTFRDAMLQYLNKYLKNQHDLKNFNDLENLPKDHLYHKSKKIIEEILSIIQNTNFEIDNSNKIILSKFIILKLAKKDLLIKNSRETYIIIKFLKKNKIISKKSHDFDKIYKDHDVNKLTSCFSEIDLSVYDNVLNLRDDLLNSILHTADENERELNLFFYLQLFSIKNYKEDIFDNFIRSQFYNLDGTIVLIYAKKHSDEYSAVNIVYFDQKLNDVLKNIFFNASKNLLDKIDYYFEKDVKYYNKKFDNFLQENFQSITSMNLDSYDKKYFKNLIKSQIQVEYQFYKSPFEYTLQESRLYPHTNYLELMKLFPEIINNEEYEAIELKNIELQNQHFSIDEDDLAEMDISEYLNINTEAYMEFRSFRKFKHIESKRDFEAYKKRLEKFIFRNENFIFPQMFHHLMYLISQSRFSSDSEKKLASSTIYRQIIILFNSCFQTIIKEGKIDITVVELIEDDINSYSNKDTRSKYFGVINPFLNIFDYHIGTQKGKSVIYARRSIIFKIELDELFTRLVEEDSNKYNMDASTAESRFIIYQRFVFCMLMYYTGMRESELWSRLTKDTYIFQDDIVVDVNTNSLVKKFKTDSAKRRIEFTIEDDNYLNIFKEYLEILENKNIKYLFPKISNTKQLVKNDVQNISYFLTINSVIQHITGRYTSLHSFRHTYATSNMRKLLMKNSKQKEDIYNLVNEIGHLGPDTTLRFYSHIDYVLNYKNCNLF